ncbi:MAG: hypothetical protein CL526_09890 [Aequorivita sp.]|nr:hypothetical protein [Aequorivita sp.]
MSEKKNIPNFKVPEGYFETFEDRLFTKISEEKFPKTSGFTVPDDYFNNLDERVLNNAKAKPTKVVNFFPKKYFGYAAAIAASLLIAVTTLNNFTTNSSLETLNLASIDNYIEEENLYYDIYDLTSLIDENEITNINLGVQLYSESAIEDYLLENLDTETLINEQ